MSSFMVWVDGTAASEGEGEGEGDDGGHGLVGGGTEFPLLRGLSAGDRWCRFVECGGASGEKAEPSGDSNADGAGPGAEDAAAAAALEGNRGHREVTGAVFKPIAGNAVYWENFRPDGTGRGWDETWHAGLPVEKGTKVGLNIWTWGRID